MNSKEDFKLRIEFLEKLLSALLGDNWRDLTLEDAEIYRMIRSNRYLWNIVITGKGQMYDEGDNIMA